MLNFDVQLDNSARKDLRRLSAKARKAIQDTFLDMEHDPFSGACSKLKGTDGYRTRVGDYRILFEIDTDLRLVNVYRIRHRKDAYR